MGNKKLRIGVVMGRPSAEHGVSLKTGRNVLRHLNKTKYTAIPILISRKGRWPIDASEIKKKFDLLFLALHGEYGEDGEIQQFLDARKIKYTGSGFGASKKGMNKIFSSRIFKRKGLHVPEFITVKGKITPSQKREYFSRAIRRFNFPLVIKPADRGSSVGIAIIRHNRHIENAFSRAAKYSRTILIQRYVSGREFTCGVLEVGGREKSLLPTEIMPSAKHSFFDYTAKYAKGASREITPPDVSRNVIKKLRKTALIAHKAIGAKGYSRTDMLMDRMGEIYVLEINTLPGLTETSLLPQEAAAMGIGFGKLLKHIIEAVR